MTIDTLLSATQRYLNSRQDPEVADWLSGFDWKTPNRTISPTTIPGIRHLASCLAVSSETERPLIQLLLDLSDKLSWRRSYSKQAFGEIFAENYGYTELIGTRGHFASDQLAMGFVFFGPQLNCPQHWHVAEELYIPLTHRALSPPAELLL